MFHLAQGTFSTRIETAHELRLVTNTQIELKNCEIAFGGTYSSGANIRKQMVFCALNRNLFLFTQFVTD